MEAWRKVFKGSIFGTWEMSVNCLPHKHKHLSLIPRYIQTMGHGSIQ